MISDPLGGLDPDQLEVAVEFDQPVAVLAGAGSGKTRAVTHRIAHAVSIGRYSATSTLAVTFTTRAAGEMRARLAALGVNGVQARTLHSAALRQAQYFWPRAYGTELPQVAPSTIGLVARATARTQRNPSTALLRDLAQEINWAKAGNVTISDYPALATLAGRTVSGLGAEQVAAIMTNYERLKTAEGVIDFDDILLCAAAMLNEHSDVLAEVRKTYRHFAVDEYQDVSAIQHALIKLWVGDRHDICVVGDPNQAIHSFAGARPEFLLNFKSDWPAARTLRLSRNYRSTPQILHMANRIAGAGSRLRSMGEPGPAPELFAYGADAEEAAGVAEWFKERRAAGTPWHEMAVLYRINAAGPTLESALVEADVPYQVRGSERYYDRAEIRQALTLIRLAASAEPESAAVAATDGVLRKCGWEPEAPLSQGALREKWESLQALRDLVGRLADEQPDLRLAELANELEQRASWQQAPVGDSVTLATMHAAKGLEWDDVALFGVREGLVPFAMAETPEQLAEERRLLFVGVTRARKRLRISWSVTGGRGRSRFLKAWAEQVENRNTSVKRTATLAARKCRVCGGSLATGSDRMLGRHSDCPSSYDEALFERLKVWRKETADAARQPAFVVFTDATLVALAEAAPTKFADLTRIPGIGKVKADRYGQQVLEVISQESEEN